MKSTSISILGSTGSIGTQVLDVVKRLGPDKVTVHALGAWSNSDMLITQALEFSPRVVCIGDETRKSVVENALSSSGIRVVAGEKGFEELAALDKVDRVVVSVAGTPGLLPTIRALENGKSVALASKEVLVSAGHIVTKLARDKGLPILPIDSEHSAIFQCLQGEKTEEIEKILLTASGGAFRDYPYEKLEKVTADEALAHPTWKMGRKVTIDSATLMNKGLEVIEAKWLFDIGPEQIEVLIHHQSIIHSMVQFCDGSVIGQLGLPDMRLPIQYSLLYPKRVDTKLPRLDLVEASKLTFDSVDYEKFECLSLALEAVKAGPSMCVVMNAADEMAVMMFLNGRIGFLDIPRTVRKVMETHSPSGDISLDEIKELDAEARIKTREIAGV